MGRGYDETNPVDRFGRWPKAHCVARGRRVLFHTARLKRVCTVTIWRRTRAANEYLNAPKTASPQPFCFRLWPQVDCLCARWQLEYRGNSQVTAALSCTVPRYGYGQTAALLQATSSRHWHSFFVRQRPCHHKAPTKRAACLMSDRAALAIRKAIFTPRTTAAGRLQHVVKLLR